MLRMLALIGFCAALGASDVQAGPFHLQYGPVSRDSQRGEFRGGDRRFRDRGLIVIDRHGNRWRGDVRRFDDGRVIVIDPRVDGRFGDERRSERDHRGGDHAESWRHGGFRGYGGYALSPQQRHRLRVR